jgi:hypothetical protein
MRDMRYGILDIGCWLNRGISMLDPGSLMLDMKSEIRETSKFSTSKQKTIDYHCLI